MLQNHMVDDGDVVIVGADGFGEGVDVVAVHDILRLEELVVLPRGEGGEHRLAEVEQLRSGHAPRLQHALEREQLIGIAGRLAFLPRSKQMDLDGPAEVP